MMKSNIFLIAALLAGSMAFTACEDFLDQKNTADLNQGTRLSRLPSIRYIIMCGGLSMKKHIMLLETDVPITLQHSIQSISNTMEI